MKNSVRRITLYFLREALGFAIVLVSIVGWCLIIGSIMFESVVMGISGVILFGGFVGFCYWVGIF